MAAIDKYIYKANKRVIVFTAVFLAVFLINIFISRGFGFEYLTLSVYDIRQLLSTKIASVTLYIMFKRGKQLILIWLLMKVINPEYVFNILLVLLSGMYGILAAVQSYYYGVSGMIILLLFLLPHYIVYFLIVKLLYDYYCDKKYEKKHILILFVILFVIGIMCECFFSRFFLFKYYQYIVLT